MSLYSSFCSSSFLNLIIDGLRFDELFSANKFTNASALSCPLGKSLFSNLIGYACNLYPFFYFFNFFPYMSLDSSTLLLQNSDQWDFLAYAIILLHHIFALFILTKFSCFILSPFLEFLPFGGYRLFAQFIPPWISRLFSYFLGMDCWAANKIVLVKFK